jgi:hypothetical protein
LIGVKPSHDVGRDRFGHRSLDCNEAAGLLNLTEQVRYSFTGRHEPAGIAGVFAHVHVVANAIEYCLPVVQVALVTVCSGDLYKLFVYHRFHPLLSILAIMALTGSMPGSCAKRAYFISPHPFFD